MLEVFWTLIPTLIIIVMAIPSFKILYLADKIDKIDMTLKVIGRQWYWQYEYPDHGNIYFDSNMIATKDLKPGQIRLLEVDNRIVLPIETNIRLLVTSGDVIHSFSVPSFGIKTDAIPGRTNETWIRILRTGVYYGQCSELCGINHGFMPIAVEAVSKEDFAKWVESKKNKTPM
jgi:cytochrome c oxidase subunit 2